MPRGGDIPEGLEILDDAGMVIAAGDARPTDPVGPVVDEAPSRRPTTLWILIGLLGCAGVLVAAVLLTRENDSTTTPADPLGILDGTGITTDDAVDATFPLFDRTWEQDVVTVVDGNVVVIDLDTGERRTVGSAGSAFVAQLAVVDGEIYTSDFGEVRRVADTGTDPVAAGDDDLGTVIVGNFAQSQNRFFSGDATLTHLASGVEIELAAVVRYAAVGDHIFFEQGGTIGIIDRDGVERDWARGELLMVGEQSVAWRHCASIGDCSYWTGTASEPEQQALDATTAANTLLFGSTTNSGGGGFLGQVPLLSPTGRHAWNISIRGDFADVDIQLVDLQTGAFLDWDDGFNQPWWTPDESAIFMTSGSSILVVDTESGRTERIVDDRLGFAGGPLALLPRG